MSIEEALEIYEIFGKDPLAGEMLTYDEVKQLIEEKAPGYSHTYGDYPLDYTLLDTSNPIYLDYFGLETPEELDALFLSKDLNNDSVFDYNEICRWFVHDSDWFCGENRIQWDRQVI